MPDGDVIRRGVRFSWRPAYEGLRAGQEPGEVGRLIAKGLSASLKDRGIPRLGDAADLIARLWRHDLSAVDAMKEVPSASGSIGGIRDSAILDRALRHVIVAGPTGSRPAQAVAEEVCRQQVEANLFAKLRPALVEDSSIAFADSEAMVEGWKLAAEDKIRGIAQQLVADPSGAVLRAPPTRGRRKKATVEMLEESVL